MENIVGVLLAGGRARRMGGGDKCLRSLAGRPLLDRIVERVRPQVSTLILNAGGDGERFAAYGLPVVADTIPDFAGPLAGVLAGLEWAANEGIPWVATFATDAPFLPDDLVARLAGAVRDAGADMACAASGGRAHPVFGLWPVALKGELRRAMEGEDMRKIDRWTARYDLVQVDFPSRPVDPFFNVNAPEDLALAKGILNPETRASA
jgi:molybdopterin-guanine dinucleotide biosynthesis protein A